MSIKARGSEVTLVIPFPGAQPCYVVVVKERRLPAYIATPDRPQPKPDREPCERAERPERPDRGLASTREPRPSPARARALPGMHLPRGREGQRDLSSSVPMSQVPGDTTRAP